VMILLNTLGCVFGSWDRIFCQDIVVVFY
jgi:hypothetical protein